MPDPKLRPLVPQTLDWIDRAPVSFEGRATTTASPQAVFEVLVDYPRWPDWFRTVRHVESIGTPTEGVGSRRRVEIPGAVFDEEFIAWEPGVRWTFTGLASRPRLTRSLVEDCRIGTDGDRTTISYTMYVDPPRALAWGSRLVAPLVRSSLSKGMEGLAARAEGRA